MRLHRRSLLSALAATSLAPALPAFAQDAAPAVDPAGDPGSFTRDGSKNRFFRGLDAGLDFYRGIEAQGGWPVVPGEKVLAKGARSPAVPLLRQRLSMTGDYIGTEYLDGQPGADLFDGELREAVVAYQNRNGMEPDGVAGPKTIADMNVPVTTRIKQMEINRERWNRMPAKLGEVFVLVNMAGYELDVVEGEKTVLTMKVIVGKGYTRTPMFSDTIQYIEFNPYWNVPRSIATKELVPEYVEKGTASAVAQGFEVKRGEEVLPVSAINWTDHLGADKLPFLIRQKPGPANALGEMKFMFPNKNNVYLHDTNQRHLFKKTKRAFSHGCVRVEKPHELAAYLLGPNTPVTGVPWGMSEVQAVVDSKTLKAVPLKRKVPVHLAYMTAWMDEFGYIQFREDIYGRDAILKSEMFPDGKAGGDPLAAELLAEKERADAIAEAEMLAQSRAELEAFEEGATVTGDVVPAPESLLPEASDPTLDPSSANDALGGLIESQALPPLGE